MKRAGAMALSFALLFASSQAGAQPAKIVDVDPQDADYIVEFFQDTLSADGLGSSGGTIKVRSKAVRRTLIRPRTSFVQALLQSCETI